MRKIKKIIAISMAAAILTMSLTAYGSNDVENMPDEPISAPKTYEDYIQLANTYLQTDDVIQALAVLDEGIEKFGAGEQGEDKQVVDLLSQRKEYILAGTVAVGTNRTTNHYNDDGSMCSSGVFEYDENGNILSYRYVNYDSAGEISSSTEYQYDGNGNRIEYKVIKDNRIYPHETWKYDEKGNQIEHICYGMDGNIAERTESEYDENGNQVRYEKYEKDGESAYKLLQNYDEHGNLLLYTEYWNGSLKHKIEREFDENNKERKAVYYDSDGNITEVTECEYAEDGSSVKRIDYDADGVIDYKMTYEYDENGNLIKYVECRCNDDGSIDRTTERKYDGIGSVIYYCYKKSGIVISTTETEFTYDEKQNRIKYDYARYEGGEKTNSIVWKKEYDEDGREAAFSLYDSEEGISYQSRIEYDENGLMINYTDYDENGVMLAKTEKKYNQSGNVIRENDYDADGNLILYYENEYDDFGSIIRQERYESGILKNEKRTSYVYHYIGNIYAEAADYIDDNLQQRKIFTRFLNGQEKVRYYRNEGNNKEGKIVEETITDILNHGHSGGAVTYTFLDMTGDGIEELIIRCGSNARICVIQCCYGTLKVIYDMPRELDENYGYGNAYLVKCNGRMGIYCDCNTRRSDEEWNEYYFWDEKGKKEIVIYKHAHFDTEIADYTYSYSMKDIDCFESRAITKGEYYDIKGGMITKMDIDWQKLEDPNYGND